MEEYALYKGEQILGIGTIKELSDILGIKESSIRFYGTPSYINRTKEKARRLVRLE